MVKTEKAEIKESVFTDDVFYNGEESARVAVRKGDLFPLLLLLLRSTRNDGGSCFSAEELIALREAIDEVLG